jgi:hypothetical protein
MISKVVLASALALASPVFAAETALAPGKLAVKFEADAAVATGVTPGATVAWLGISRGRDEWTDHLYHWRQSTTDADKDGVVSYARKGGFPQHTMLLAVDVSTLTCAVGATFPLGDEIPQLDLADAIADPTGLLTAFEQRGSRIDVLVVRAGVGAWSARVLDGSSLDLDRTRDGVVTIGFGTLRPLAGTTARLDGVLLGDVVAAADAHGPWLRVARIPDGGRP